MHKSTNVLDALPKSVHGRAKAAIREITEAEDKAHARLAVEAFSEEFGFKWPRAAERITKDEEALLCYYDYPAEHWRHLRTTNPIESPFACVRARTKLTKGPGSREAGLAMIYKLLETPGVEMEEAQRRSPGGIGQSRCEVRERSVGRGKRSRKRGAEGRRVIEGRSTTLDNTST